MHITVYVNGFYDWEPVPKNTIVTEADIKAKKVKPGMNGEQLMKVVKEGETETSVGLPESDLIDMIVHEAVKEKKVITRTEAVGLWLSRHIMPEHAHRSHIEDFETHDDGPDLALFETKINAQIEVGNISELDRADLIAAYTLPVVDGEHHVHHLHQHFGVQKTRHRSMRLKAARAAAAASADVESEPIETTEMKAVQ